jgi:hypothetical protein
MADTTANGYPYAVPSDPLVQWPSTSQSLAEKVDSQHLTVGVSQLTGDGQSVVTVPVPPGTRLISIHAGATVGGPPLVCSIIAADKAKVWGLHNPELSPGVGNWPNGSAEFVWVAIPT